MPNNAQVSDDVWMADDRVGWDSDLEMNGWDDQEDSLISRNTEPGQ